MGLCGRGPSLGRLHGHKALKTFHEQPKTCRIQVLLRDASGARRLWPNVGEKRSVILNTASLWRPGRDVKTELESTDPCDIVLASFFCKAASKEHPTETRKASKTVTTLSPDMP